MHTYNEIMKQAQQLDKTKEIVQSLTFNEDAVDIVLFTGCGTSFYLAIAAARYYQSATGEVAVAVPASELFLHTDIHILSNKKYNIIGISRSGTTSEIIMALEHLNGSENIRTMAVTCNGDTPMAEVANEVIALNDISEKSVVMTQSFSNMLYALQLYAAKISQRVELMNQLEKIPALVKTALGNGEQLKQVTEDLTKKRFIFLGSGAYNGLAKEATLKLKEMTQTECESYSNLEFRHGPISIVDEATVVILFTQKETKDFDQALIKDIQKLGGFVGVIGIASADLEADLIIRLSEDIDDLNRLVEVVPYFQLLAYQRAIFKGYDPDKPRNLTQVVSL
ncbi:SIS domain-containing protein [Lysinibacillus xylanilyticus]|uniref:SIS domain-containing protein n=1 Tax=Lysinibacillus xylanilyticus TaxID=582475 RepID=UPI002E219428|nr:SIS domain-containing protein [Lysinibacillus xylanilyticus]